MKIHVHATCKNEATFLPWFLAHYATFADRIFLYDGHSTDGTREIAKAHPLVTLLDDDSGADGLRDDLLAGLKSKCWQGHGADWVIVVDSDELLYCCGTPMRERLAQFERDGVAVPKPIGYDLTGREFPDTAEIPAGRQIYDVIRRGLLSGNYSKCCVFDARKVESLTYGCGCHDADFLLADGSRIGSKDLVRPMGFHLLHFRRVGGPEFYLARRREHALHMSKENLDNGWGFHCMFALTDPDFVRRDYMEFETLAAEIPGLEPSARAPAPVLPYTGREMVVARYNEDILWVRPLVAAGMSATIYDKSAQPVCGGENFTVSPRRNEGRESETWLHHIIERYDSLSPLTFFAQGDPFFHSPDFRSRLSAEYVEPTTLTTIGSGHPDPASDLVQRQCGLEVRYARACDADADETWRRVFACDPPKPLFYGYGCMYAVPREFIRRRSLKAWRWLYGRRMEAWRAGVEYSHRAPGVNGFVMETVFWQLLQGPERYPTWADAGREPPRRSMVGVDPDIYFPLDEHCRSLGV